ncbi:MAG: DUF2721 domain-containing protein, partial [Chloroflexi bacterium]|nr:DUF2721 domain-containing protein [Chloroflexota bacterium]
CILLLVINNRYTHVLDRLRSIIQSESSNRETQIHILFRRASILRISILSLCSSIVLSSLILCCTVFEAFGYGNHHMFAGILLLASTICIVSSAVTLWLDVVQSLKAIRSYLNACESPQE